MKKLFLLSIYFHVALNCFSQSVGIGTAIPHSSAQLEITSTAKGLLIPRMNTADISAIGSPAKGLMVYDSTKNQLMVNMGNSSVPNWQTIVSNSGWSLNGNNGINPSNHFIGTIDNNRLLFKIGNQFAGKLDSSSGQTFFGFGAGKNLTPLVSATNYPSTAFGFMALNTASAVYGNTALGGRALYSCTNGTFNTAVGNSAMYSNTEGVDNTAMGVDALRENTTGNLNVAYGKYALEGNVTGSNNTGIGWAAGASTTTARYNTLVGFAAGSAFNMGYNNTLLGAEIQMIEDGVYNSIGIGEAITITAPSQARIGNSSTNSIGGYAGWTTFSDGRFKKNIQENVAGIDFIMKLRPITYNLNVTSISETLNESRGREMHESSKTAIANKEKILYSGFIAQEVEKAALESDYDFSGVDKPQNANDFYGLRYGEFVVPLVKAVQQLKLELESIKIELNSLKEQNRQLLEKLNKQN